MSETTRLFLLAVLVAALAALGLAVFLIGAETLRNLAYILVGGLVLAAIIASCALPIRAHRKKDMTGETRYVDGTRTVIKERVLDGRAISAPEVKVLQLPQQPAGGAWPELLRASYQAGLLGAQPGPSRAGGQADTMPQFDFDRAEDEWGGLINP